MVILQLQHTAHAIIGSNCPGISGSVPDFKRLSRVPEGSATYLPDEGQTLCRLIDFRFVDRGYTALEAESALVQHSTCFVA